MAQISHYQQQQHKTELGKAPYKQHQQAQQHNCILIQLHELWHKQKLDHEFIPEQHIQSALCFRQEKIDSGLAVIAIRHVELATAALIVAEVLRCLLCTCTTKTTIGRRAATLQGGNERIKKKHGDNRLWITITTKHTSSAKRNTRHYGYGETDE